VVWSAAYGPFGEMGTIPALIVQNLRLPGQEFDLETGLYHNGFRDYAPGWGRYLQSDPIGLLGGINTYAYVGANPVNVIDRLGLYGWADFQSDLDTAWSWTEQKANDAWNSPCVVKVRITAEELYNKAEQLLKKLEPTAETIKLLKDLYDTAKGDILGPVNIILHFAKERADDPNKSWGSRCVPADSPSHCGQY
jgi:RHS repeat-associated protein